MPRNSEQSQYDRNWAGTINAGGRRSRMTTSGRISEEATDERWTDNRGKRRRRRSYTWEYPETIPGGINTVISLGKGPWMHK